MQTFFTIIYELLCGKNQSSSDYRDRIYGSVGLLTLVGAILLGILFYIVLGRWRNVWHTLTHWGITVFLAAFCGFGIAFILAKKIIGSVDGYLIQFAIMNGIQLAVYFMLFSMVLKPFSIFSKRTPF